MSKTVRKEKEGKIEKELDREKSELKLITDLIKILLSNMKNLKRSDRKTKQRKNNINKTTDGMKII